MRERKNCARVCGQVAVLAAVLLVTTAARAGEKTLSILRPGAIVLSRQVVEPPASALGAADDVPLTVSPVRFSGMVRSEAKLLAVVRKGALRLDDRTREGVESYLPFRIDNGDIVCDVPVHPRLSGRQEVSLVDLSHSVEYEHPAHLDADPLDTAPPGGRPPLVLVHGACFDELSRPDEGDKNGVWDSLRHDPDYVALAQHYRLMLFSYPTYRSVEENGETLARLIDEEVGIAGLADRSMAFVAHSMGGLVIRRAMAQRSLGAKVGVAVTLATPHHGSILANLLWANWGIARKVGPLYALAIKVAASKMPMCPGLESLWSDNHDFAISAGDRGEFGLPVNDEQASFEAHERYLDRLVCLAGDVHSLVGHGQYFVEYELVRLGCIAFNPMYSNIDPLVPFASGIFEGQPVAAVTTFPDIDHGTILTDTSVHQAIIDALTHPPAPAFAQRVARRTLPLER